MIDTHMHLTMKEFDEDREKILNEFESVGVKCAIEVGYNMESSKKAVELSKKYKRVYSAVGIHPHDAKDADESWIEKIKELAQNPKTVAIGEIGLDYYRDLSPRQVQKEVFEKQLGLASSLKMPVIFHVRDAYEDVRDIVRHYDVDGVVHSFNGTLEDAKDFVKMGLYIGVGGIATYKKNAELRHTISRLPIERILTETDSPYLSPQPVRGKRNEPKNIRFIIEMLSEIFKMSYFELEKQTEENAKKLFGLC